MSSGIGILLTILASLSLLVLGLPIYTLSNEYINSDNIIGSSSYLAPLTSIPMDLNGIVEIRALDDYDGDGLPDAVLLNTTHIIVYYSSSDPLVVFTGLPPLYMDSLSHMYIVDNLLFIVSSYSNDLRLTIIDLLNKTIIINSLIDRPYIGLGIHGFIKNSSEYIIYVRVFDQYRFREALLPIKYVVNISHPIIGDPIYTEAVELTYNVVNGFCRVKPILCSYVLDRDIRIIYSGNGSFTVTTNNWNIVFYEKYLSFTTYKGSLVLISMTNNKYYLRIIDPVNGSIEYYITIPSILSNYTLIDYHILYDKLAIVYMEKSSGTHRILYYSLPDLVFLGYMDIPSDYLPLHPTMDLDQDGLPEYLIIYKNYLSIIYTVNRSIEYIKWIPSTYRFDWRGLYFSEHLYLYMIMNYMGRNRLFLLKLDEWESIDNTPPQIITVSPNSTITYSPIRIEALVNDDKPIYSLEINLLSGSGDTIYYRKFYNRTSISHTIDLEIGDYVLNISATNTDGLSSYTLYTFIVIEKPSPPNIRPIIVVAEPTNWSVITDPVFSLSLAIAYPWDVDIDIYINGSFYTSLHGNGSLTECIDLSEFLDGVYVLDIIVDNNVSRKLYIIKDTKPPEITIIAPVNDSIVEHRFDLVFSVLEEFLDDVYVYVDNILIQHIDDPFEREFSIEINPWDYSLGLHTITIYAVDIAGHKGSCFITLYFNVSLENTYIYVSLKPSNTMFVEGILELRITCSQESMGIIRLVSSNGRDYLISLWSGNSTHYIDTTMYADGIYRLSVDLLEPNGTYVTVWNRTLYIDNNAPEMTIQFPWDMSVYGYYVPRDLLIDYGDCYGVRNILLTIYDPFPDHVYVVINGETYDLEEIANRSWSIAGGLQSLITLPLPCSGWANISFHVFDVVGHSSTKNLTLYIDLDPPVVHGVPDTIYSCSGNVSLELDIVEQSGVSEAYIIINNTRYSFTRHYSLMLTLEEGIWKAYVIVIDRVGNIYNKTLHIVVDKTPPFIEITYNITYDNNGYARIDLETQIVDSLSGIEHIAIYINGEKVHEKTLDGEHEVHLETKTHIAYGETINITATAYDKTGNKATKTILENPWRRTNTTTHTGENREHPRQIDTTTILIATTITAITITTLIAKTRKTRKTK